MTGALATLSSMFKMSPHGGLPYIEFRCRAEPVHYCLIKEEENGKLWYFNIKRYIKDKEYPPEASDSNKRTLRRLAANFLLSGSVLYKRNHDMVLLQCLNAKEVEQMLVEI